MNDRDGFTTDMDSSAQRRHRRRTGAEDGSGETRRIPVAPADSAAEPADGEAKPEGKTAEPAEEGLGRVDNRVPAEARRMAAAPYGQEYPDRRRPGTRPLTAPPRPQEAAPSGEKANGRALAKELRRQTAVGYAPGRMKEGYTRQVPAQPDYRGQPGNGGYAGSRDARAYLENRGQPFRNGGQEREPEPEVKPAPRALKTLVYLLLAIGAVLTALLCLRSLNEGRVARDAGRVINFAENKPEDATVCTDVTYSVLTSKDVQEIRLVNEVGEEVPVILVGADNADGNAWVMTLNMTEDFQGTLRLQVRVSDEWRETDYTSSRLTVRGTTGFSQALAEQLLAEATASQELENPETPVPEGTEEVAPEPTPTGAPEQEGGDESEEPPRAAPEEDDEVSGENDDTSFREVGELRTAVPTATPEPEEVVKPTETPPLTVEAVPEANPDLISNVTIYVGSKKQKDYNRPAKELIHMPEADAYTPDKMGVLTFRGDNFRRNAAVGSLEAEPVGLSVQWEVESGSSRGVNQTYYGYGWPGQPAIVKWSKQVRAMMNLYESKLEKKMLKEVIIAGQDGNIRFLDLEDGSLTRNSIKLGYPMNGTPSLHTVGQPYLSVGQFARKMKVKTGRIGLRQYNLYNQKELKMIDGLDTKHRRPLNNIGSFETSALIDRKSDTLITAGSNGMLYLEALNSSFDYNVGVMSLSISETAMTSRTKAQKNTALTAVESSLAAYDKYVFYADMGGVLRCVNTDTLRPVWAVETGDAVMAAVALDLTGNRELNLYTANMLANRKKGTGTIQIRRYDALSGREAWCTDVGVYKSKKDKADVGAKASPVIGQQGLGDLVFFTVTGLSDEGRQQLKLSGEEKAALIALDKQTGKVVWALGLDSRTESSPVAVYDPEGRGWIIQCEQDGTIHLVEGLTGRETGSLKLEAEIIASPAVYNDTMVIGTTGRGTSFIYGIRIGTSASGGEDAGTETAEAEEASDRIPEEVGDEAAMDEAAEDEWNDEWNDGGDEADE